MVPRKGDVEWLFVFARRVIALDPELMPDAARILDALAEVDVEPNKRFDEIDHSLRLLLRAVAGMAEARVSSDARSRNSRGSSRSASA